MNTSKRIASGLLGAGTIALLAGCGGGTSMQTPSSTSTVSTEVSTAPVMSPTSVPTSAPGS